MKILLLAGEESGMIYRGKIAAKLRERLPDAEIRGYGDYGFKTGDLAVMGIFQVLRKIFYFLRVKRTMERAIEEWRPDVVCTIDYPGLNLKLAAFAKARGIRSVHVVCPQVWAWHQSRIPKIEASLDKICCFFPFEPKIFRPGLGVFVGHPLVDEMKGSDRNDKERIIELSNNRIIECSGDRTNELSNNRIIECSGDRTNELSNNRIIECSGDRTNELSNNRIIECSGDRTNGVATAHSTNQAVEPPTGNSTIRLFENSIISLALLPGSRVGEIRHHLPKLVEVVNVLKREMTNLRVVIPAANEKARRAISQFGGANPPFEVRDGGARELLRAADAAVVASGTATLEAGLARCPTVLVYHVDWLFEAICRITLKGVKHIGLVNIVCEKLGAPCPMPELIQQDFTVPKMLAYLRPWLTDAAANAAARKALDDAVGLLKSDGDAVAQIVDEIVAPEI